MCVSLVIQTFTPILHLTLASEFQVYMILILVRKNTQKRKIEVIIFKIQKRQTSEQGLLYNCIMKKKFLQEDITILNIYTPMDTTEQLN